MPTSNEEPLAHALRDVARHLHHAASVDSTLQAIVHAAVDTIDEADRAGVLLVEGRSKLAVPALTDDLVRQVDDLQVEFDQGPCIDAVRHEKTVQVADTAIERRWPRLGVRSMLSFQLYSDGQNLGSLSLFAAKPHAFDERTVLVGDLFATHAALALHRSTTVDGLRAAIASRDVIGQAKGILMHRDGITADDAFTMLVRASQHTNIKLVEVARWVAESGAPRAARRASLG